MKRYLIIFIFLPHFLSAQDLSRLDSLIRSYSTYQDDSSKIVAINNYAESQVNQDVEFSSLIYQYMIKTGKEKGYHYSIGMAYNGLGLVAFNKGDYVSSLDFYYRASEIAEIYHYKSLLANVLNNIGIVHKENGQYENAIDVFSKCLKIKEELKDYESIANTLNNLGIVFRKTGNKNKAKECYLKSKDLYEKINNLKGIAHSYTNLGILAYGEGDLKTTFEFLEKSLILYRDCNDKNKISSTLYNIGLIHSNLKNYPAAIRYLSQSLEVARSIQDQGIIRNIYQAFSELYAARFQYQLAYKFLLNYVDINDSIMGDNVKQTLSELQTKYETAEKEKKISRLKEQKIQHEYEIEKQSGQIHIQKIIIISVVLGLLIILVFSVFTYRLYKQKVKANDILSKQKIQIQEQNTILLQHQEEIIAQRNAIEVQNEELSKINQLVEQKNKHITDSIKYALRIQEAIFPPFELREKILPNSLVFFQPKDIVSGDFYYIDEVNEDVYFAVVDCTGHGVPGAFMSIVGFTILSQALHEKHIFKPSEILDYLNIKVATTLRQSDEHNSVKDGMELCLCKYNKNSQILEFAGARNPLVRVNEKGAIEYRTDSVSIGSLLEEDFKFRNYSIQLRENDCIYIFSDGFADQFGGSERKKFQKKNLLDLFKSIDHLPPNEQLSIITSTFNLWKGSVDQYDDVLVLGFKQK